MSMGERIRKSREECGLLQTQLAELVGVKSSGVISNWERDENKPNADQLVLLCKALNIKLSYLLDYNGNPEKILSITKHKERRNGLSKKEYRVGRAYGKAPQREQGIVEQVLDPYMEEEPEDNIIRVDFSQSERRASAGTGVYLDDEYMTTVKVRADALPSNYQKYPERYFGIPVSGDSMEPRFHDNDVLIVSKEPVNVGEIGIFVMENEGYVKELGRGVLHSLNPDYGDIPLTEDVKCYGKVVDTLDPGAIGEE